MNEIDETFSSVADGVNGPSASAQGDAQSLNPTGAAAPAATSLRRPAFDIVDETGPRMQTGYIPLYGRQAPAVALKKEAPHHRRMIELSAQGYTIKEIAQITGFTVVSVANTLKQPFLQETLVNEIHRHAKVDDEVMELVADCAVDAVKLFRDAMKSDAAPWQARINAANSILDRKYGKANQPVTIRDQVDLDTLSDAELAAMLPKTGKTATSL